MRSSASVPTVACSRRLIPIDSPAIHIRPDIPDGSDTSDSDKYITREFLRNVELTGEMLRLADADTDASRAFLALSARVDSASWVMHPEDVPVSAARVVAVLNNWICATQGLSPPRRAAGLVAADRLLNRAWAVARLWDSTAAEPRLDLGKIGATSFSAPEEDGFYYRDAWLQDAADVDPNSPAGQAARLLQIRHSCAYLGELAEYDSLITHAEALAATALDPRVRTEANFIAADAYRDIVVLSFGGVEGEGEGNTDSTDYAPRAGASREKAIAHYAKALAVDSTSWFAASALADYHRLKNGEQPTELRFFCRGD